MIAIEAWQSAGARRVVSKQATVHAKTTHAHLRYIHMLQHLKIHQPGYQLWLRHHCAGPCWM